MEQKRHFIPGYVMSSANDCPAVKHKSESELFRRVYGQSEKPFYTPASIQVAAAEPVRAAL